VGLVALTTADGSQPKQRAGWLQGAPTRRPVGAMLTARRDSGGTDSRYRRPYG